MWKKVHPRLVFITTLTVLVLLGGTTFFLNRLDATALRFHVPNLSKFWAPDTTQQTHNLDTAVLVTFYQIDNPELNVDTSIVSSKTENPDVPSDSDTLGKPKKVKIVGQEHLKNKIYSLQFPPNNPNLLAPFYESLRRETGKRTIRILHFGDSQIEGDRISGYLRHRFQERFGGSGPGLLTCSPPLAQHATIEQKVEGSWIHDNVMNPSSVTNHLSFGIMGQTSVFTNVPPQQAAIHFRLSYLSYPTARNYNWVRIFLGKSNYPLEINLYGKDSLILVDSFVPEDELNVFGFMLNKTPTDITFRFRSQQSPNFYAIVLDQTTGVTVDNIPWRGSSGAQFSKIDKDLLRYFFKQLNVRFIILQFGVNVVKNIQNSYRWYEDILVKQLEHLRSATGDTPILLVGVSDMSRKVDGGYESYPNIPAIRDAQRRAAFRTGCAFWDCYEAMGGKNSMQEWVNADPPLANKDFVHFNMRGNKIIAHMLYQAIMEHYESSVVQP
ncbi:MAG TPA: GDSL-type esterase/lipase family protein [Salinivirgaceae bacterium]|nr:GDSL-type esterase/lipase family protein [Salinivirgaceae bacterium]